MPSETLEGNGYILKENSQVASFFSKGTNFAGALNAFLFC